MSFLVTNFSDFAKGVKDLLTKNVKHEHKAKVKTTTTQGVALDTGVQAKSSKASKATVFVGTVKATYKPVDFGSFEAEVSTDNSSKANIESDKLLDGLTAKIEGVDSKNDVSAAIKATYRHEASAIGSLQVEHVRKFVAKPGKPVKKLGTNAYVNAAFGLEGLSVGGQLRYNQEKKETEYDAGFHYEHGDFTGGIQSKGNMTKWQLDLLHQYTAAFRWGAQVQYEVKGGNREYAAAAAYQVDSNTFVKGVFQTKDNSLVVSYNQKNVAPNVQAAVTLGFDASNISTTPSDAGVSLIFGDADSQK